MTTDSLQRLCFYSCFNCIRTRNTISIPIPVRYADLCAYRSKLHIEAMQILNDDRDNQKQTNSNTTDVITDLMEQKEHQIIQNLNKSVKLHNKIKQLLFYC